MKIETSFRFGFALLCLLASSALRGEVKEGEILEPELGVYIDINEEEWGAAQVNLRIVDNNFQMYFLDGNKLLVKPPVDDAIVHYGNYIKDSNAKNTILLEKKDMMLTAARVISPPHRYKARIFLRKTVEPEAVYEEPYQVKEFIGMHIINQLGDDFYDKSKTQPTSVAPPVEEGADEGEEEEKASE